MALSELWKKFIRDEEPADDDASYYRPRKKANAPSLIDDPDDDTFRARGKRVGASRAAQANDYDDELSYDDGYEPVGKPRFKKVTATGIKSAEHVVDLVLEKFVVLVNTRNVPDTSLSAFRCYIAGAVRALGAHITPLDDENVFVSIAPFDASPYMPADDTAAQDDDLI